MKKETKQNMTFNALAVWGLLSFFVLIGEPDETLTISYVLWAKAGAALSMALCVLTGMLLQNNGYLPDLGDGQQEEEKCKED